MALDMPTYLLFKKTALVSAADRIPFDVLQLIFEEAVESSDPLARMRFSLAVASVSRPWRATAHNVAALWTTIYISYLTAPPIEVIRQMLQRSQARSLEVYVDWVLNPASSHDEPGVYWKPRVALAHSAGPHNTSSYISKATHLLTDHVRRWRTADVMWTGPRECSFEAVDEIFRPLSLAKADQMEELHLSGLNLFHYTFHAPRLRTLTLYADEWLSYDYMQRVAESCPALEDFTCHEETWDIALPFPSGFMVPLAGRLRRLKLVGWATTWQGSIGAVLLFPVLMELEVECMPANYSIRHVLEGITAPQLRRLAIESCYPYVHHASLTQYCDRFPLLQHLRYRITLYSEGFNNVAECRLFCLFCDFFRLIEVVIDKGLDGVLST